MATTPSDYNALAGSLLNRRLRLNSYSLYLRHVVAVGAFGVLFLAEEYDRGVATCRKFAVKCLLRSQSVHANDKFIIREKTLHPLVSHPSVARIHAVIEQADLVYLVMDYFQDGDLFKAIVDRHEYVGQDEMVRDAFLQVAAGLQACHARGVFHRDIKPENILVRSGYPGSYPRLALADFGLSTNEEYSSEFGVGSTYYMSLECGSRVNLRGERLDAYSSRSNDVWSLGILLINLACGRNPWLRAHFDEPTFGAFLHNPNHLLSILPISLQLNELLKLVFCLNPEERIGLDGMIAFVSRIDRFTLDWNELCCASETVRAAAGPLFRVREKQEKLARLLASCDLQSFSYPATYSHLQPSNFGISPGAEYMCDGGQESEDDWRSYVGDDFGDLLGSDRGSISAQTLAYCNEECCNGVDEEEYEAQEFPVHRVTLDPRDPSPTLSRQVADLQSPSIGSLESFAQQIFSLSAVLQPAHQLGNVKQTGGFGMGTDSPALSDSVSLPSTPGGPRTPATVVNHVHQYTSNAPNFSYTQDGVGMPVSATRQALGLYDDPTLVPYKHKAQSPLPDLPTHFFGELY